MKERFEGETGRRLLIEALKTQKMVIGNTALAEDLSGLVEVMEVKAGETIIHQGAFDNLIFFILVGSFSIVVHGQTVAKRFPNDHVGEMATIEPSQARAATVIANEDSVVCKITEPHLADLGQRYGDIWHNFSRELARRLAQRNALVRPVREKIRVFIISSTEALSIAREVQSNFERDNIFVEVWIDGVFKASCYPLEDFERKVADSDFAIAIAHPDDLTEMRGSSQLTPRDNVIFELGLFIGRLGRQRSLLLEPRDDKVKLPSDLSGLTTIGYKYGPPQDLPSLLAPACNKIRKIINELGPRC